jgi:hypothetical protein
MEPIDLELDESELELPAEPMHAQHGPVAPGDARHGAHRARARRRDRQVKADVQIGYLHRGFEKMCERGTWAAGLSLHGSTQLRIADAQQRRLRARRREAARGITVPRRGQILRVIHGELGAHVRSPHVQRRDGHGARRVHPISLVHQGSRVALGDHRDADGRAHDPLVRAHRRGSPRRTPKTSVTCASPCCPKCSASWPKASRCCSRTESFSTARKASAC